jgi:hypothetical protein
LPSVQRVNCASARGVPACVFLASTP